MGVRKDESRGRWLAEAYISGKRVRKWFGSKAEANRYFTALKAENSPIAQKVIVKTEQSPLLSELIQLWYELHGRSLRNGNRLLSRLGYMAEAMGNPLAKDVSASMFAEYRARRLNGDVTFWRYREQVKESTVNNEKVLLGGVFNELERLGKWSGGNPLKNVRSFKVREREIVFLSNDEIKRLLHVIDNYKFSPDLKIVVRLALATGARWSEVVNLTRSQIIPYKVTFPNTKNGKVRTVPISKELYEMIPDKSGRLFTAEMTAFAKMIKKAGIVLPEGKNTHILRHTFASHFMMNGGNLLVLRDILGHSDIKMTMRYAHFAPSFLESAVTLNPLNNI